MIKLNDIRFRYPHGEFALALASLEVAKAATLAFVGPSGTGKTTLLNIISGILVPDQGTVIVDGNGVSALSDSARRSFRASRIGLVFQEFELLSYLDVMDNILLPFRISPLLRLTPQVRDSAATLAEETGIADKLTRNVGRLSQGEKQRVAICRALLTDPPVVLADEPTGSLDPVNKLRILDILFEQVKQRQATLIMVTHDHQLLDRFDRVLDFADLHATIDIAKGSVEA